jgi:hypothetical protein
VGSIPFDLRPDPSELGPVGSGALADGDGDRRPPIANRVDRCATFLYTAAVIVAAQRNPPMFAAAR